MERLPKAGVTVGLGACLLLAGCISPMDELESAVDVERSIRAQWMRDVGAAAPRSKSIALGGVSSELPQITEQGTLTDCLRYAAAESRALEAAFLNWRAALEEVPQVTALPDPQAGYGYFIDEVETRVGPQEHRLNIAQKFPWFGKLELRGDVAAQAADAEFERFQAAALELFQRVELAYNELFYLRGAIELTRDNLELLTQFEKIARTRYKVGAGSHPDVVRLQVELGKLEDRLRELTDRRRPLAARLNAALNRPADAPAPWPVELAPPQEPYEIEPLVAALKQRNPDLAALQRRLDQHRTATELARKDAWPDIMLKLDYIVTGEALNPSAPESGKDPIIAGVSVNLPIWRDRYEASVREAIKRRLATASTRADLESRLVAGLEMAVFEHADAVRKVALYRDSLLPKARESLEASIIGYQNATVGFLDLLDAERVLLALELARRRAITDTANAAATIHMLVGADPATISHDVEPPEDAP